MLFCKGYGKKKVGLYWACLPTLLSWSLKKKKKKQQQQQQQKQTNELY